MRLIPFFATLFPLVLAAQYNGPESIEHDAVGMRYFVSNTGDNSIKQRDYDGAVTAFAANLSGAPYGIELQGDTLFACIDGGLRGYATGDATEVFNLPLGGSFLNGLASDGHFLYTTDFSTKKIYKVDPATLTFSTLVSNTGSTPNGIVWDAALDRLWVVFWGSNAKIKSYDRNTGAELSTFTTSLSNIDGVTLDCLGRILVSSWSPARVSAFENTFTAAPVTLASTGLSSPADLDFDEVNHVVCIPNSGNNTVTLTAVEGCATGVMQITGKGTFEVCPNPTTGVLELGVDITSPTPFLVFNARGILVASGHLSPKAQLDISNLAPGVYLIDVPSLGKSAKVLRH
ncbi:MAG: T9SS type A sorting domain-containing protein [Flavobacteriales bacterium]